MRFRAWSGLVAVRRPAVVLAMAVPVIVAAPVAVAASAAPGIQAHVSAARVLPGAPMPREGAGKAGAATRLDLRHMGSHHTFAAHGGNRMPLGPNGKPLGASLPKRAPGGHRSAPSVKSAVVNPAATPTPSPTPTPGPNGMGFSVNSSFDGSHAANCGNCFPPDPSAAVGVNDIAEVVNNQLQGYDKSGNLLCTNTLNTLLQTSSSLGDPRIQYDNLNDRFSLVAEVFPSSASATPSLFVAASQSGDPCGAWNTYDVTFGGSPFPAGATLDFPQLGEDSGALMISVNDFDSTNAYISSQAFTIPKSAVYNGQGFSFGTSQVDFSTAPVVVSGVPMASTSTTYWLAALPGTGYDVFSMPTGGGAISFAETVSAPFSGPNEQVSQPGTSTTLNPGSGYIMSPPAQDGDFIWFTNDVDDAGFPTVQYGNIEVSTDQAFTALAYHANDSEDFNPSISVTGSNGGGDTTMWLNWAYTETPEGIPVSDTVTAEFAIEGQASGILSPNPDLVGTDTTLVTGSSSGNSEFGLYSSVAMDPVQVPSPPGSTCGATAVTDQEYFDGSGNWVTHLAQVDICSVIPR